MSGGAWWEDHHHHHHHDDHHGGDCSDDPKPPPPVCFASGTLIYTPRGPVKVEDLVAGDTVLTRDHGSQRLLWTGSTEVGGTLRELLPSYLPVRIAAGSLGDGMPVRDMYVSRQHRILRTGADCALMFSSDEVLTPAAGLTALPGIEVCAPGDLPSGAKDGRWSYHHLLCREHEVLFAEGTWVESFWPGASALSSLAPAALQSLLDAVPALKDGPDSYGEPARPFVQAWEGRLAA